MNLTIKYVDMKMILLSTFMILFAATLSFASIEGTWHGTLQKNEVILRLQADGKRFTGIFYTRSADHVITDGRINGNEINFTMINNNNKVPAKGRINGDQMTLTISYPKNEAMGELKRILPGMPMPVLMKPQITEFYEPVPKIINPGSYAGIVPPPSDAIVLFDGKDLSKWKGRSGEAQWEVHDGVFTVKKGTGDIETKDVFDDFQLHIEWRIPADIDGQGQARGNSGVFLQGRYEVQVLDSYINKTYTNGQAGSIYKQAPPLVNAMRKPGEWNVYDIIYTAPRFREDGTVLYPARVTVLHNGVLIQNNFEIQGHTTYIGFPEYNKHGKGPIRLQDHGDPSKPISYRNIWIREL
jgi:hypothetical protein